MCFNLVVCLFAACVVLPLVVGDLISVSSVQQCINDGSDTPKGCSSKIVVALIVVNGQVYFAHESDNVVPLSLGCIVF